MDLISSFTELILNYSNSLHLKADNFWADNNPSSFAGVGVSEAVGNRMASL